MILPPPPPPEPTPSPPYLPPVPPPTSKVGGGGGDFVQYMNSSYMQQLVKGDFRRVFHVAVGNGLAFFHVKISTNIVLFSLH